MARLLWEHEGQVIKDYPFPRGSVTIGRRKENTIVFPNPEVSSTHARIDKVGTDYILTDLQSTNGTFVNNLKVFSHRLSHGDRISIGKNVLLFIGTEKAKMDAERANIPLDRTVILGGTHQKRKISSPAVPIESYVVEPAPARHFLRLLVLGLLVVGALGVAAVFSLKDKGSLLGGILPKTLQGQGTAKKPAPPSEGSLTASQSAESAAVNEENPEEQEAQRSPINIEAIVWSSEAKNCFVVINGAERRVGDSIEGMTIARIERDHVVLQSQEGQSIVRLTFK